MPISDTNNDKSNQTGVAAVDRAFLIVNAVASSEGPISLADLSRETGLYKSTLLRLIASLEKTSLVIRRHDGRYLLGPYAHKLGRAYQTTFQLTDTLQPLLEEAVAMGSESSSFHVYNDSDTRMCLLRIDSNHSTLDSINVGDLLPLVHGAAGRLIRRFQGGNTAPSLENVFELSMGERDPDCAAVACAVFGVNNEFIGAISLSGPKERFTPEAIASLETMVRQISQKASEQLGARWPAA